MPSIRSDCSAISIRRALAAAACALAAFMSSVVGAAGEGGIRLGRDGRLAYPAGVAVLGPNRLAITSGRAVLGDNLP